MQERFLPFEVLVRALLWPMAEELRIGIVADIATVTAMTKAAVSNVQANLTAGANVPGSLDTLFGVLLQQLAQPATAAIDSGHPAASNNTANAQTDPVPQTDPQAFRQTPQDVSPLIGLLQNAGPQPTVQTCTYPGTVPIEPANGAAFLLQQSQAAQSQSDGATATNDPKFAANAIPQSGDFAAANAVTAAPAPDAQPTTQAAPEKAAKPAAKDDQKKTADTVPLFMNYSLSDTIPERFRKGKE